MPLRNLLLSTLALFTLAACGPEAPREQAPGAEPAQDAPASVSQMAPPPCNTVSVACPFGGSVSCRVSNSVCILGRTDCSVVCDGVERYCPGTSLDYCPR